MIVNFGQRFLAHQTQSLASLSLKRILLTLDGSVAIPMSVLMVMRINQ